MQIRVIVNGATGKMGALACTTIEQHSEFALVAGLSKNENLVEHIKSTAAQIVVDLTIAEQLSKLEHAQ